MENNTAGNPENQHKEDIAKKYFDEQQYSTFIVGGGEIKQKDQKEIDVLINLITSETREEKDAALILLKKENGAKLLIEAISQTPDQKNKALLIAACWESGLDLQGHQRFFSELAVNEDPFISLEAITVLESNAEGIETSELQKITAILNNAIDKKHVNKALLQDLVLMLKDGSGNVE